ncbi:hypothetical protein MKK88_16230 [Methylobacterium sp. E-005]|uniref:hypothetical protein n=1 Tax=Methylobacterium sp. E-005 TaxID=2836549 RepID=UPI001FB9BAEE|nr:hypothetical protein [Methylobacterium sp. E-005]MCJ2087517.1 hypothetical protein [Methylobacterium sp. E-005]
MGGLSAMKARGRSKVTNGNRLLPEVDGRTVWARRMRDLIQAHTADLGGDSEMSEAERSLVRRAATLATELERLEAQFAAAGAADPETLDLYGRQAGTLKRILEGLGLRRRPRDVTPDLREHIDARPAA